MDRIFYQAASAMMLQQRKLETVSNNVANIKTAGYKPETVVTTSFTDVLAARLDEDGLYYSSTVIGNNAPLSIVDEVMQYFSQGDINETTRPFDFAISGDGYFNINDAEGNTYSYKRGGGKLLNCKMLDTVKVQVVSNDSTKNIETVVAAMIESTSIASASILYTSTPIASSFEITSFIISSVPAPSAAITATFALPA